jgi:hypothetical protein
MALSDLIATVVDGEALLKVVVGSFVGAVVLTIGSACAILGAVGYADMRRDERALEASAFALLGVAGLLATAAVVVIGLVVMLSK